MGTYAAYYSPHISSVIWVLMIYLLEIARSLGGARKRGEFGIHRGIGWAFETEPNVAIRKFGSD